MNTEYLYYCYNKCALVSYFTFHNCEYLMLFIIQSKSLEYRGCGVEGVTKGPWFSPSGVSFCQSSNSMSTWCTLGMRVKKGSLCIQSVVLCAGGAPTA